MASRLNPYLNFDGNARQALEFYQSVFGGDLNLNPFADFGAPGTPDADAMRAYWEKLSAGGTTTMPMEKHAWGDEFGMCVDKFGVPWLVNIHAGD